MGTFFKTPKERALKLLAKVDNGLLLHISFTPRFSGQRAPTVLLVKNECGVKVYRGDKKATDKLIFTTMFTEEHHILRNDFEEIELPPQRSFKEAIEKVVDLLPYFPTLNYYTLGTPNESD